MSVDDSGADDTGEARPASDGTGDVSPAITVVSGDPSAEELAAVTAVLSALLEEQSAGHGIEVPRGPSAWQRTQRDVRSPLYPGLGVWRGFAG